MKRFKLITLCLSYFSLLTAGGLAFDREIELGKADNWQDLIRFEKTMLQEGKWGAQDIVLKDAQHEWQPDTELLLHFNSPTPENLNGLYSTQGATQLISPKSFIYGSGSGAFQGNRNQLELLPRKGSLFMPETIWGDFTLEFWLQPLTLINGEILLSWNGARQDGKQLRQQIFNCTINDRKVVWYFENFFYSPTGGETRYALKSLRGLLPGKWNHHLLRFESTTGLLEYLIDGIPEAILYATDSHKEASTVNLPYIGPVAPGNLKIGSSYTGLLDELHWRRSFVSNAGTTRFTEQPGRVISKVYDLEYTSSLVKQIDAVYDTPRDSEVYFFYKIAPQLQGWDSLAGDWIQFHPGEPLPGGTTGKYFQFMLELFPSGNLEQSPAVSALHFMYQPDLPPAPPSYLTATPGNGSVTLSWNKVNEYDIGGYFIYYGYRSGNYAADEGLPGPSPLDAGNTTRFEITNLTNGKLYYFTVVAYDTSVPAHRSLFSREVNARPSVLHP